MSILQFDKHATSLMKVIALTILLVTLVLIAFGSSLSRKTGQRSGTLILTNGTRLRMVRFNVSRSSSVVLTLAKSVSQAAEGEKAFTLVGSVK
jgi:hypothetical protein